MDLLQISPDYIKALCAYSTRINNKKRKTTEHEFVANMVQIILGDNQTTDVVDGMMASLTALNPDCFPLFIGVALKDKGFRVPGAIRAIVKGEEAEVSLDTVSCVADQGSELNIIDPTLVSMLDLTTLSLTRSGHRGLVMNTADGSSTPLTSYVRCTFGAMGVWRDIECFVRPSSKGDTALLLGLPWLHSVKAVIHVRESVIEIGDPMCKETTHLIQTPQFIPSTNQKLLLVPIAPEYQAKVQLAEQAMSANLRPITDRITDRITDVTMDIDAESIQDTTDPDEYASTESSKDSDSTDPDSTTSYDSDASSNSTDSLN